MGTYILEDENALKGILKNLLATKAADGVMVQSRSENGVFTSLITDPELIDDTVPLAPMFSINIARHLQHNGGRRIVVVARPCEARAINELVKLKQIDPETLLVISHDCLGTVDPMEATLAEPLTEEGLEGLEKDSVSLRTACRVCEHFTPPEADVCIMSIGVDSGYLLVTDRDELIEGLNLKDGEVPAGREEKVGAILEMRREAGREMTEDIRERLSNYDSLLEVFQHCIRCDNCREMCPICYCKECYFQTALGDPKTDEMVHQAGIKGILRVPPDILFYHLTRNIHVAMGCVECGSCEEACPRDIPLMSIWKSITPDVQSLFEYVSGEKKDEPMPLVSFKESELEEIGSE